MRIKSRKSQTRVISFMKKDVIWQFGYKPIIFPMTIKTYRYYCATILQWFIICNRLTN